MFNKILCPTDFSEPAGTALEIAHRLADQSGAEWILLHVVDYVPVLPPPTVGTASPAFDEPKYQRALREHAQHQLDELAASWRDKGVPVQTHLAEGSAAKRIVAYANDNDVDLIVIATHGRTGVQRFLFGSVAEKVLRSASCPVLTIRHPES